MTEGEPARGADALLATLRSGLIHELNQPLAVARGYLELLQTRDDEELRRIAPERIHEAIERAALLVEFLAGLIDLETGVPVEDQPGDGALAVALERVGGLAAARRVTLDVAGEPDRADPVVLGALFAMAVERAARGSSVRVETGAEGTHVSWQGDAISESLVTAIDAEGWRGDAASLPAHLARRRLSRLDGSLVVAGASLAARPA